MGDERVVLSRRGTLSERAIGSAMDGHRRLGPGLLESVYEECLCCELEQTGLAFGPQVPLAIVRKALYLECPPSAGSCRRAATDRRSEIPREDSGYSRKLKC